MPLIFEWDVEKARQNIIKHDISFDEASSAFRDPISITISDPHHSEDEERFVLPGYSNRNRLLVVIHTDRGDHIRLIGARLANREERKQYEEEKI